MESFKLTLLHIDDSLDDRLLLQTAIDPKRFDYYGTDGLQGALDYFASSRTNRPRGGSDPALVLLDYDLGFQCATDFLYWLRVQRRNTAIPVIIYSGTSNDDHVRECYQLGVNHFLRKPRSFTRTKVIAIAIGACFLRKRPDFRFLDRLPEAIPDPTGTGTVYTQPHPVSTC